MLAQSEQSQSLLEFAFLPTIAVRCLRFATEERLSVRHSDFWWMNSDGAKLTK